MGLLSVKLFRSVGGFGLGGWHDFDRWCCDFIFVGHEAEEGDYEEEGDRADGDYHGVVVGSRHVGVQAVLLPGHVNIASKQLFLLVGPPGP